MGAQARRRAQALRKAREQSHTVAHLQSVKRAARANELYRSAEHGDIHAVLQWTNDPRRPKLRLLLHALLRHKPLEETVFLHVLRWCPRRRRRRIMMGGTPSTYCATSRRGRRP